MARKTVYIPDDLNERVAECGDVSDSYSSIVQAALVEYLDRREMDTEGSSG